jgi:iron-sulfur cluster repair protein YtfE (RIC family)
MNLNYRVTRSLHQEHETTLILIGKLATLLNRTKASETPSVSEPALFDVLSGLRIALDAELEAHFAFEEKELFPLLEAEGESELGDLLIEEHKEIFPVRQQMKALVGDALTNGFQGETWPNFHRLGLEFVQRLTGHVDKEEMGLIPALEDILSDEDDQKIADSYDLQP